MAETVRVKPIDAANVSWLVDGDETARVGHAPSGELVVEWPGLARLTVDANGGRVLTPLAPIDPVVLKKIEDGLASAIPEYLRGAFVFHASAVACAEKGLLILGPAGSGKSTTAARLCETGASLLADDCAVGVVEGDRFIVKPTESQHWLAASALAKVPVTAREVASRPVVTRTIAVLAVDSTLADVRVMPLRGVEAVGATLEAMLRLPLGPSQAVADFARIQALLQRVRVHKVLRPSTFTVTLSNSLTSILLDLTE